MPDPFDLPAGVAPPAFYIAAMGRSGSTMLCNWLSRPPEKLVFIEPFFLHDRNPRLLRIQLEDFGMPAGDEEWNRGDINPNERFARLMGPRLQGKEWALKEVLCQEHQAVIEAFDPPRVLISVRHIVDVALSFFEKHRVQGNTDRFSDQWVVDYCVREAAGLVELKHKLERAGRPVLVARYEDVISSPAIRSRIERFTGWNGGNPVGTHLGKFDRMFELERHGNAIAEVPRNRGDRALDEANLQTSTMIERICETYQREFGYR